MGAEGVTIWLDMVPGCVAKQGGATDDGFRFFDVLDRFSYSVDNGTCGLREVVIGNSNSQR